jgi:hypothetical protein
VDADLSAVRSQIIALAKRWETSVGDPTLLQVVDDARKAVLEPASGVTLRFLTEWLDPPLGAAAVVGSDQNSPFLPEDEVILEYDVLVSLENLPLARIDPFKFSASEIPPVSAPSEPGRERVILPTTELGSYARRVDYGSPTMFIGRFGELRRRSLEEYLKLPLGEHIVVHEFGHVLGLAHEHQNPHYTDRPYRDVETMSLAIKTGFALDELPTDDEVRQQVLERWPGNLAFSDWRDTRNDSLYELDSVMTYPYHRSLLRPREKEDSKRLGLEAHFKAILSDLPEEPPVVRPTATDVLNIIQMYQRRWRHGGAAQQAGA